MNQPEIRESALCCPICEEDGGLHHAAVQVWTRKGEDQSGTATEVSSTGLATTFPAQEGFLGRRDDVRIEFFCEHHVGRFWLRFHQHKGRTLTGWAGASGLPGTETLRLALPDGCATQCPACGNAYSDSLACCAACFATKPFAPRPWTAERRERAGKAAFGVGLLALGSRARELVDILWQALPSGEKAWWWDRAEAVIQEDEAGG